MFKLFGFKKVLSVFVVSLSLLLIPVVSGAADSAKPIQKVFLKLDHGTDDLHSVMMALKLAQGMTSKGAKVTVFLNLESVRIADKRQPLDLSWGKSGGHTVLELLESLISNGVDVLVCPMCAKNAGIETKDLRKGTRIASSMEEIAASILEADKTLNY
jgi:predicted peroxiredoxin